RPGQPALAAGRPASQGFRRTGGGALAKSPACGRARQGARGGPRARLWDGRAVEPEARFDPVVLDALGRRGHAIQLGGAWTMRVGGIQAVAIDPTTGLMTGACDPRRDGYVATA